MFANIKNRFIAVIAPDMPPLPSPSDHRLGSGGHHMRQQQQYKQDKFAYARPPFLQLLTQDELRASADHNVRPIIVPRDISLLPWGAGYAECVNSGKSEWNEDQGAFCRQVLSDPSHRHPDLPYTYFGIFDGHAGYGAALAASHQFHHILHEKLVDCIDMLLPRDYAVDELLATTKSATNGFPHPVHFQRRVSKDELIIGALEAAFFHMDALIAQDRDRYRDAGGCTACVSLFIGGKMFVANAGDSRAVLCHRIGENSRAVPFSFDHTPETERPRLLNVARLKPGLLGKQYAAMEYAKRPHAKDLGQRILCRQGTMRGWTYKTLTRDDLRMPVVTGEGKRSRLLGTLGVTRGFGDHDLLAINTGIHIKPFLTPHPDVNYFDLPGAHDCGVLVMATDGLWDVSENEDVAATVFNTLAKYPTEKHRHTMVAQELVARARGKINDSGHWRLSDGKAATVDDISVIVIPVYQYFKEHVEWEQKHELEYQQRLAREKEATAVVAAAAAQQAAELTAQESTAAAALLNGLITTQAQVLADDDDDDDDNEEREDDDDEEDIVVEVNRQKMQALVEEEKPEEQQHASASSNITAEESTTAAAVDTQLNATVSALEATEISAPEKRDTPQTSPGKSNKAKQPQQLRNRNRKDKR